MLYLAAPYTHADPNIRRARAHCITVLTGELMRRITYDWFFSPIVQGHSVAQHLPPEVREDHDFWMRQCLPMLKVCDWLIVLPIHGWRESRGIAEEMAFAEVNRIPTFLWQAADPQFELLYDEEIEICQYSISRSTNLIDNEKGFA